MLSQFNLRRAQEAAIVSVSRDGTSRLKLYLKQQIATLPLEKCRPIVAINGVDTKVYIDLIIPKSPFPDPDAAYNTMMFSVPALAHFRDSELSAFMATFLQDDITNETTYTFDDGSSITFANHIAISVTPPSISTS